MGNSCIDLSLSNIWNSWFEFKKGKTKTKELEFFNYYLERNLYDLHYELNNGLYKHGGYRKFTVTDNKKREIRVADIKDRIVHRITYEYLYRIYDKTFIYDVWSCRKEKGLHGVIERTEKSLRKYKNCFIWRTDIKKFFDSVDQQVLLKIICRKIKNEKILYLIKEVIKSYRTQPNKKESEHTPQKGMPIGNLTSQILANIYLNELDRFVKYTIKPQVYLRYGDDFIIISKNLSELKKLRNKTIRFINERLSLKINDQNDIIIKAKWGLKFLGVWIYPSGRKLNKRNHQRIKKRLEHKNISSYSGLVKKHSKEKSVKELNWLILEYYEKQI